MRQVFEGIKVAELIWAETGPLITKYLADHGATVIHIESTTRVDTARMSPPYKDNIVGPDRGGFYVDRNSNKYSATLNLNHPKGIEIAKKFVAWVDIFVEAFTAGTTKKWGLAYEDLKKIKPDIIMLSTCIFGQTGPRASLPGLGSQLTGLAGFVHLTGWPDREAAQPFGPHTDYLVPSLGGAALIAAIDYRRRTGRGQYLDLSQYEAALQYLSPPLLAYSANHEVTIRDGNRCQYAAPHGVYPCKGDDRWCAIAVASDEEWESFCQAIGNPAWTNDPKFSTLLGRKENEDKLEALIANWTSNFEAEEVMGRMQSAGVPAGVVQNCKDIQEDIQLWHRDYFTKLDHPVIGKHTVGRSPFILSQSPAKINKHAPCLGQDNEYVYTQILGIPDDQFIELLNAGVFE